MFLKLYYHFRILFIVINKNTELLSFKTFISQKIGYKLSALPSSGNTINNTNKHE